MGALAGGCRAPCGDGAYLLAKPDDVLSSAWLIAARRAEVDQQDGADRRAIAIVDMPAP
jgi:hypothetical protein